MTDLIVTAPNGVRWQRDPGGTSEPAELLAVLGSYFDVSRDWNLWQSGAVQDAQERRRAVLAEWDHADPPPGGYKFETGEQIQAEFDARHAARERERGARAEAYDPDLAQARLHVLQQQATAGFIRHVLAHPASEAQRAKAEARLAAAEQEAASLMARVGDPDAVADDARLVVALCRVYPVPARAPMGAARRRCPASAQTSGQKCSPRCCGRYSPRTTSRRVSPGKNLTRAACCNSVSARPSGKRQTCATS